MQKLPRYAYLKEREALVHQLSDVDRSTVAGFHEQLNTGDAVTLSRTEVRMLLQPVFRPDETTLESITHFSRTGVDYVLQCTPPDCGIETFFPDSLVQYTMRKFSIEEAKVPACTVHPELNSGTKIWTQRVHPLEGNPALQYARSKQWRRLFLYKSLEFQNRHDLVHEQRHVFSACDDVAALFSPEDIETISDTYYTRNVNVPFPVSIRIPCIVLENRQRILHELRYEHRPFIFSTDDTTVSPAYPPHPHVTAFEDRGGTFCPF